MREGPKEALYAVGCAVIVARDSRDDAEAAVADVDEIASDALGLGNVVPAHAWPWRVRVVMAGRHEGNGLGAQQFIDVRTATASDEQHSIDATFEQRAYFTCLAFGLVVGAREKELETVLLDRLLEAIDEAGEERAVDGRYGGTHCPRVA